MGGGSGDDGVESNTVAGGDAVTVNVRCSNGTKFSVQASLESSVESFKSVVAQNCDIPAEQQRLIYKGRILKDDQTLKSYGMEADHTVHLVRGFVPATSTPAGGAPTRANTTTPSAGEARSVEGDTIGGTGLGGSLFPGLGLGGLGGNGGMFGAGLPELEQMQRLLLQPLVLTQLVLPLQILIHFLIPGLLVCEFAGGANQTNAAATNPSGTTRSPRAGGLGGLGAPGLEGLFGGTTPDPNSMSQLMQNPAISQMMQSLLSNPQYMNQILGLNPQMRTMLESNPQLREMMQNPDFIRQLTSPETMQQMMTLQQSLFSGLGQQQTNRDAGQTGGGTGSPNNMNLNMDMLMNMFGSLGTGGFTPPNNSNVPPEELYATQLAQLQEMGFFDTRENLQALTATRGNVHAAVERLLGNLGQ
ncbi:putative Ubiquitin-like domain, Heat shock chaperonin-binding, UBA-like superfamily, ubiquilin [Helianthus annuus]|nr:putative Ubiquitin-like domain, Heat shock chaperonin-binding, UBA-like superfamily, ubiquilin [Helianthus annuus]